MTPAQRQRLRALRERLKAEDPDVLEAVREVSPALLDWCLEQSPRARLIACTNAARALGKLRRAASS